YRVCSETGGAHKNGLENQTATADISVKARFDASRELQNRPASTDFGYRHSKANSARFAAPSSQATRLMRQAAPKDGCKLSPKGACASGKLALNFATLGAHLRCRQY